VKRVQWRYPVKSLKRAEERLRRDLKFYGGTGDGNCAGLDERNPRIVPKTHKDGTVWYHTMVDDIILDPERT